MYLYESAIFNENESSKSFAVLNNWFSNLFPSFKF